VEGGRQGARKSTLEAFKANGDMKWRAKFLPCSLTAKIINACMTSSAADSPPVARPWRFTLRELLVVVMLLAIALAGFQYLMAHARKVIYHDWAHNNLKQIVLGLHNFNDDHSSLPYAIQLDTDDRKQRPPLQRTTMRGKPLYSWRYSIANYIDSSWSRPLFDQPWDAASQAVWRKRWQPYSIRQGENTNYLAITGPGTAWGDGTTPPLSLQDLDGDTILIVEVRNSGTHWMQPGDFDIRTMPRTINAPDGKGISGEYANGFTIGLADGRVRFLPRNVPFEVLEKFFTVEGAKQYDLDEELAPYLAN
jgi:hypothetical protein